MSRFIDDPHQNQQLLEVIRDNIDCHSGKISFADYMALALYHPHFGFYNQQNYQQHFLTAPHISPLFAKCLALQISDVFKILKQKTLLEFGAGSGQLACDLIDNLAAENNLPDEYIIIEKSVMLRNQQQILLKQTHPEYFKCIKWLDKLPVNFEGVMIANEVLDALPVHCFAFRGQKIQERYVTIHDDKLSWIEDEPSQKLNSAVKNLQQKILFPQDYQSEINLHLSDFVKEISESLTKGIVFIFDYGYGQAEYYHHERTQGTMTCFYQHQKNNDPFHLPGFQDITAHVDFTLLAENAVDAELDVFGYTSQASFLLACRLLDFATEIENKLSIREQISFHTGIKVLTMPTEMGERIKVMSLGKNISALLRGFQFHDRRRDL